jgi:hypothetical protein
MFAVRETIPPGGGGEAGMKGGSLPEEAAEVLYLRNKCLLLWICTYAGISRAISHVREDYLASQMRTESRSREIFDQGENIIFSMFNLGGS